MSFKDHGLNTAMVPTGGWRYEQPHKDGVQRIPHKGDAGTAERLLDLVQIFRARAHIDMGDPERDIALYIKSVSPQNNRFPNKAEREAPRVKIRPLIERIRDFILRISDHPPRLIFDAEAHARAQVCLTCPQNVRWMTGCVPCCSEITERGQNLRRKPADEEADKLRACRLHNFYLPSIVFLDREELGEANEKAPEFCWMKTEPLPLSDEEMTAKEKPKLEDIVAPIVQPDPSLPV
jgi:hypothetical protein